MLIKCNAVLSHPNRTREIDIECFKVEQGYLKVLHHNFDHYRICSFANFNISVNEAYTKVRNVIYQNGTSVDTDSVDGIFIMLMDMKFLPSKMKQNLPQLKALMVYDSGLTQLDHWDMKQFGSDILIVQFTKNKLTALGGDLFEFNPNLIYVNFKGNPLKFIHPKLFENFKRMKKLEVIDFQECSCFNDGRRFEKREKCDIHIFDWNADSCHHKWTEIKLNCRLKNMPFFISNQNTLHLHVCVVENPSWFVDDFTTKVSEIAFNIKIVGTMRPNTLAIYEAYNHLKFLPSGIKEMFPNLKVLDIKKCGLMHLDVNDMLQFGSDIVAIHLERTRLTVLENNLFQFNTNLMSISIIENPLKYIDPQFFDNLKRRKGTLETVELNGDCSCIEYGGRKFKKSEGHDIETFMWHIDDCNDIDVKVENEGRYYKRIKDVELRV